MGLYNKDDEVAMLRPVYKKTSSSSIVKTCETCPQVDIFIFYSSKLYFIMVITGSVVFIIAGVGDWTIGTDITVANGWITSEKRGLLGIPTSGWEYADGTCGAACWFADPDLKFN